MSKLKLSQWHDGSVKPVHDGVYERDYSGKGIYRACPYALFEYGLWMLGGSTVTSASLEVCESNHQNLPWRGVVK